MDFFVAISASRVHPGVTFVIMDIYLSKLQASLLVTVFNGETQI